MLSMHPEYLNTPRLVADAAGTTVWRWDQQEPFGANPANEDPDANSVAFDLPLRLPGQRHDAESGLHYNYYRDYDSSLGIYKQSDPIGLAGGVNTYAYVGSSPLVKTDPYGLLAVAGDALAMGWLLRQPPGEAAQRMGEEAGRLCALKIPCNAGNQVANLINAECQPLISFSGGTRSTIAPVAFNACVDTCRSEWTRRCQPRLSCAPLAG